MDKKKIYVVAEVVYNPYNHTTDEYIICLTESKDKATAVRDKYAEKMAADENVEILIGEYNLDEEYFG